MCKRIQRKRTKGKRLIARTRPCDAIYVGRPTRWGNHFDVALYGRSIAVSLFRGYAELRAEREPDWLAPLRGHDLACWCPLVDGQGNPVPCHADVLLELANQ